MNPENKTYFYIYEVINLINGKNYIGQHITDNLEDGYLGSGKALKAAIKKYGRENFKKEILVFANGSASLNFIEKCLIPLWWAELPTNYNMMEGGHNGSRMTQETRNKISKSRTGKKLGPMSEAQRLAMSEQRRGKQPDHLAKLVKENHPRIGKRHSEESKKKMALAKLGKKMPPRSKEYCEKISQRMKNRIVSEETKRKMSEAKKKTLLT